MKDLIDELKVLLIDAGSSRLKWRRYSGGRIFGGGASPHNGQSETLIPGIVGAERTDRVLVASVLDEEATARMAAMLEDRCSVHPEFARSVAEGHGVTNAYAQAEQLGVDRWLSLIAARHLKTGPALVADCGTAVTLDVIDGEGRHQGGLILPGIGMAHHCLMAHTRLDVARIMPQGLLGTDTASCVANGMHSAVAALIDRLSLTGGSSDGAVPVIMTGADAPSVASLVKAPLEIRPDLVFEGLARWAGLDLIQ